MKLLIGPRKILFYFLFLNLKYKKWVQNQTSSHVLLEASRVVAVSYIYSNLNQDLIRPASGPPSSPPFLEVGMKRMKTTFSTYFVWPLVICMKDFSRYVFKYQSFSFIFKCKYWAFYLF